MGGAPHPVRLVVDDDLRRSRLTVFFRLLLAIPHFVWFVLWSLLALVLAVVQWLVTLVAGRPAASLHGFYSSYVRYATHLFAYLYLAADPYPGFTGEPGYPVDVELPGPNRQSRLRTLFRLVIALAAIALATALMGGGGGGGRARAQEEGARRRRPPRAGAGSASHSRVPSWRGSPRSCEAEPRAACAT